MPPRQGAPSTGASRSRSSTGRAMDGTPSAISLRAVVAAAVALAAPLAAGVLTLGLGGGESVAAPPTAPGSWATGPFSYDAAETRRQSAFETELETGARLPSFGFHT